VLAIDYLPLTEGDILHITSCPTIRKLGIMAHHKATQKAIRQSEKVTARNRSNRSRVRNVVKNVENLAAAGDAKGAAEALKDAQKLLDKSVSQKLAKRNTTSRKLSRLNAMVKKAAGK
jgi:small subunit ribosomal protein S20